MPALRQTSLLIVLTSLIVIGGCGKESPTPPPPKMESGATATQPAPTAASPAQPAPAAAPSTASAGVNDQAASDLANKSGCLACHTVDKKIIGPAYKEIAAKYRGQPDAESQLIQKVKNGGKGVWGQIPMPPNAHVKDEDIKTLVEWVLSQK